MNSTHAIGGLKCLYGAEQYHAETYDESMLDHKLHVETADADDCARDLSALDADGGASAVETGSRSGGSRLAAGAERGIALGAGSPEPTNDDRTAAAARAGRWISRRRRPEPPARTFPCACLSRHLFSMLTDERFKRNIAVQ